MPQSFFNPGPTLVSVLVSITQTSASIALGSTLQLSATATGTMSDGSHVSLSVRWETDCPAIATVDQTGLVTGSTGTSVVPYWTAGGTVRISAYALRQDSSPVGSPAVCVLNVKGAATTARKRSGGIFGDPGFNYGLS